MALQSPLGAKVIACVYLRERLLHQEDKSVVANDLLDAQGGISRRHLIGGGGVALTAGLIGFTPDIAEAGPSRRLLKLYNPRTREKLQVVYRVGNRYSRNGLRKVDQIMKDWRSGDVRKMDPKVIDYLYSVQRWLGAKQPVHIISGYRSTATNAMLARRKRGVAKNSYHTKGMAIDIKIPTYSVRSIARAAESMKLGGVGRYSRSDFVHIDSADLRTWGR